MGQQDQPDMAATNRCEVPIQFGGYEEGIFCDVLLMDVTYILLGHLWLYDLNVTHHGGHNTCTIRYMNKSIILNLG